MLTQILVTVALAAILVATGSLVALHALPTGSRRSATR